MGEKKFKRFVYQLFSEIFFVVNYFWIGYYVLKKNWKKLKNLIWFNVINFKGLIYFQSRI